MSNNLFDPQLEKTFKKDKQLLEQAAIPIVTVSSSYMEDLKGFHNLPEVDTSTDVVFSRAHYTMALAAAVEAWGNKINPSKAWVVDPTNYVKANDWFSIRLTETVGKTVARAPFLKKLKDLVDKFGRNKLPILSSITPPLLYLTENIDKPILSFHIAAGNILAAQGKTVYQMITDPHVREEYLNEAQRANMRFLVFNQKTKTDFLEKAAILGKKVNPEQVIVTGPPIDPRIIAARKNKRPWRSGSLRLCLTTGGLGTNKTEIRSILEQLLPELRKRPNPYQLMVYVGTHRDLAELVRNLAKKERVALKEIAPEDPADFVFQGQLKDPYSRRWVEQQINQARLSLIYHPQIIDANELLIHYGFAWADGFLTKPSGDMAYDAAASGSFLLTLTEWGEWEHNIREIFVQKSIARQAKTKNIAAQLQALTSAQGKAESWVEQAMRSAQNIDKVFLEGTKNILKAVNGVEK
jgi:hypothetical protein